MDRPVIAGGACPPLVPCRTPSRAAPLRGPAAERAGTITSSLELANGQGWIGLALVRRGCLAATQLHAGEGSGAIALAISTPPGYVAPPVGAGGGS